MGKKLPSGAANIAKQTTVKKVSPKMKKKAPKKAAKKKDNKPACKPRVLKRTKFPVRHNNGKKRGRNVKKVVRDPTSLVQVEAKAGSKAEWGRRRRRSRRRRR